MKKRIFITLLSAVLVVGGVIPCVAFAVSSTNTASITADDAKSMALFHAGLAESDVTFIKVKLDRDDGRQVYEVNFYSGNAKYDYDINATSGVIVSFDYDTEHYTIPSAGSYSTSAALSTSEYIGEDSAKSIALAKVPGATESNIYLHLDYDDGMVVYEGSIVYNELEYEFEMNAINGTIVEWDVESVYDD